MPSGPAPARVAVSPDSRNVYVTNSDSTVSQYSAGPDGTLTPKSPAAVPTGTDPAIAGATGVVVSPDGASVYVTNPTAPEGAPGSVSQYSVNGSGELAPKTPATVPAGEDRFGWL